MSGDRTIDPSLLQVESGLNLGDSNADMSKEFPLYGLNDQICSPVLDFNPDTNFLDFPDISTFAPSTEVPEPGVTEVDSSHTAQQQYLSGPIKKAVSGGSEHPSIANQHNDLTPLRLELIEEIAEQLVKSVQTSLHTATMETASFEKTVKPKKRYNTIAQAVTATCSSEATEKDAQIESHRLALGKEALAACANITEKTNLQHFPNMIRCHQDIPKFYNCSVREEIFGLWQFARDYAAQVCGQIWDLWCHYAFHNTWYEEIINHEGWMQFSPFVDLSTPPEGLYGQDLFDTTFAKDHELEALSVELDNTTQAMRKLCQDCERDYLFDPSQLGSQKPVQDVETSDSYDTDDGADVRYAVMRDFLTTFQKDNTRSILRLGPVLQSRIRKDIRAWARIAHCACIRLPNDMILIHKEWVQRPRRHRRKRNTGLRGRETPDYGQLSCKYCPRRFKNENETERHENSLHRRRTSWSCAALLRIEEAFSAPSFTDADVCGYCGNEFPNPPQRNVREEHLNINHNFQGCNRSQEFFRADHFREHLKYSHHAVLDNQWTSILEYNCMKQDADVVTSYAEAEHTSRFTMPESDDPGIGKHCKNDIWQPRDKYLGYASASSISSESMASTGSTAKKRRLARNEDGYACDFPGCRKTYDRQCDLRQHKRCHRSEVDLPCQCNICWKRFPYPKDLKRHMIVHEK